MSSSPEFLQSQKKYGYTSFDSQQKAKLVANDLSTVTESVESKLLQLVQFIHKALDKKWTSAQIKVSLLSHGWTEDLISKAYAVAIHTRTKTKDELKLKDALGDLTSQYTKLSVKNKAIHDLFFTSEQKIYMDKLRGHFSPHFYSKFKKNLPIGNKDNGKVHEPDTAENRSSQQVGQSQPSVIVQNSQPVPQNGGIPSVAQPAPPTPQPSNIIIQADKSAVKGPDENSALAPTVEISEKQLSIMANIAAKSSQYSRPSVSGRDANSSAEVHHHHYGSGEMGLYNPVVAEKVEYTETPIGDRAQTGIPDLDGVISGGLKRKSTTLVSGGAGTGKTTFGLQYLINGIIMFNEPGIFITFEQSRQGIIELGLQFGWDLEHLEKEGMLIIHEYSPKQLQNALESGGGSFRDLIESIKSKRLVIDSITEYEMLFGSEISQRKQLTDLFKGLAKWDITTVIIGQEHSVSKNHISSVLDYESDAVILLYNERRGDIRLRSLEIYKMRGTKHAGRIFPMKITDNGTVVVTKNISLVTGKL